MGHYDNSPSPLTALGGGTQSILGPGGLVEGVGGILTNLQSGNFATAAVTAARMGTNFKGANLKTIATQEFNQLAKDVIRGQNTQSTIFVPTQASAQNGRSTSIYGIPKAASANKVLNMNSADSLIPSIGLGRIDL
jgi:hypothetical protein